MNVFFLLYVCLFVPDILNHYRPVCQWALLLLALTETSKISQNKNFYMGPLFNESL